MSLVKCGCGLLPELYSWTRDLGGYDGYETRVRVRCECGMQTLSLIDNESNRERVTTIWNDSFAVTVYL